MNIAGNVAVNINLNEFSKLLLSSGWKKIPFRKDYIALYKKESEDQFFQIALPQTRSFRDYENVVLAAIDEYAKSEGIPQKEALLTVQYPNSDILNLRINDDQIQAGSITMDAAVRIYDNAKKLLTATAMDIIDPKKTHNGRQPQAVSSFISNCRFGQTEIGSYIIPVVCPLQSLDESTEDAQQLSLLSDEETLSYSFTRQVTSRLMDNLGVINDCVRNEGNLEAIIDRPSEKIISSNFIEALEELNEMKNPEDYLDFHISWARRAPANRSEIQNMSFSRDIKPILSAASGKLKDTVRPDISVLGRITKLQSIPEASERKDGTVEVVYLDEHSRKKSSKFILGKEDYYLAIDAHRRGNQVRIGGTTAQGFKNTYKALSVSIIED